MLQLCNYNCLKKYLLKKLIEALCHLNHAEETLT